MQTRFGHPVTWRGMLLLAWMQLEKIKPATTRPALSQGRNLVSWQPGARSRREDELQRMRKPE